MSQKSIKANFVMNIILTVSMFIFPLITFPYVSRVLLPIGIGKVSFATSVVSYFVLFSQLGIPTYGIRVCAQARDDKEKLTRTVHELFIINLVMSGVAYAIFGFCLLTVPRLQAEKSLFLIVSTSIALTTLGMEWVYKALEQYTYITIRSIIFKFISVVAMFLLLHNEQDYVCYGGITVFASYASYMMNFFHIHKYIGTRPVGNYDFKRHLKPICVFFAMTCASTIYTNLDTVMLGFMKSDIDVGYYNAAIKIKLILVSIITSLGTVLLPRSSYYVEKKLMNEFYSVSSKALNFVFLAASPMVIYFLIFAEECIMFLSGAEFQNSIIPMQVLLPTVLFIGITNILGIQILIPLGKEKIVLYSEIVGAIVDVILNCILIPQFATTGAAIGTLAAEVAVLIFQYVAIRKSLIKKLEKIQYWKIIVGVTLGTASSVIVKQFDLNCFISLVVSAIIFIGVYSCSLIVTKERMAIEFFKQIRYKVRSLCEGNKVN